VAVPFPNARICYSVDEALMLLLTALLACADQSVKLGQADLEDVECQDGEIRVASTGAAYSTLTDAFHHAATVDRVCVGAGTWNLIDDESCRSRASAFDGEVLEVVGAGSDRTRLIGGGDACAELYFSSERDTDRRALQGVTLWNAPVLFWDGAVELSDVRVSGYAGGNRAIRVKARTLQVQGLTISDNVVDYGAGFELYGDGSFEGLVVEDNRSQAGYVGEISGTVSWRGGHVSGNTRTGESPGYDFLETWGVVSIENVGIFDNRANGPALTGHGELALADVSLIGNDSNWHGVLTAEDSLTVTGGAIRQNVGADGAVALLGAGTADFSDVDIEDNGACAVSGDGACLATDPGPGTTLNCDTSGCR